MLAAAERSACRRPAGGGLCRPCRRSGRPTETTEVIAAAFSSIGDKGYQGSGYITPIKKTRSRELLQWEKEFNADVSRLRAPVERAIAHIKSWRILHTDYRRPLRTYLTSFRAAIGLYFFKLACE
jgi:transposase